MSDLTKIADQISELTVMQAAELSKLLVERFDLEIAAPVVAAPAAAAPVVEEQTLFDVILTSAGAQKVGVIKEVRVLRPDLNLMQAKDLVDGAPQTIKSGVSKGDAEAMKAKLEEAGAKIEIK